MILFWLLWVSLVLGGVAGGLSCNEAFRGKWLLMKRVPAPVRRSVWRRLGGTGDSLQAAVLAERPVAASRAGPFRFGAAP
jgi:hypothetical protein